MTNVWIFTTSTGAAYNATQTNPDIRDGDVLIVPSEGVAGIMFKAWPIALTTQHGHFQQFAVPPADVSDIQDIHLDGIECAERYMSDLTSHNFVENGRSVTKTIKILDRDALAQGGTFRVLSPIERDY